MYKRLLLPVGITLLAVLCWSLAGKGTHTSYEEAQQLLLFRRIGHEMLLAAGDSTSRVLPIRKEAKGPFRLEFEKRFTPQAEWLVSIADKAIRTDASAARYMVQLTDMERGEVVYSFEAPVQDPEKVPCLGRVLPGGWYAVTFLSSKVADASWFSRPAVWYVSGVTLLILGFTWSGLRHKKYQRHTVKEENLPAGELPAFVPVGQFQFYPDRQILFFNNIPIELTGKESKLLSIFSRMPNTVINRQLLLKEGWEDEGVITGRSLDMYVSKLRKKLKDDPSVSITNIHGKGYRLNC